MTDPAHNETDEILKRLEKRISEEYALAVQEVQEKLEDYLRRFEVKDKTWREWVKTGYKTKDEYKQWKVGQMAIGRRWTQLRDNLAEDFHNANMIAKSIIFEHMPEVYAINHDYGVYEIEHGLNLDTSYTLYDRQTVERLFDDNEKLYHDPGMATSQRIAAGIDIRWNRQQIQSAMLQAILQGETIPAIASRIANQVGESNRKAAIRNARTITTGVENRGRVDSYKRAQEMGIDLRQQWVATLDSRTRHEHRLLDGQTAKVGGYFEVEGVKIRYPGDPEAPGYLVYNCRCTLIAYMKGFERDMSDLNGRNTKNFDNMSYEEWKNERESTSKSINEPEEKSENIKNAYTAEYRRKKKRK